MTSNPIPDPFWTFEHTAWERGARAYHNFWIRLTNQTIEPLLSAVQSGDTTRLLDVATGAGNVAQAGVRKGIRVVGIDFSTSMLAQALNVSIEHQDTTCDLSSAQRLKRVVDSLQRVGSRHQFIQI